MWEERDRESLLPKKRSVASNVKLRPIMESVANKKKRRKYKKLKMKKNKH